MPETEGEGIPSKGNSKDNSVRVGSLCEGTGCIRFCGQVLEVKLGPDDESLLGVLHSGARGLKDSLERSNTSRFVL